MAVEPGSDVHIPKEVEEAAEMAEQLMAQMNQTQAAPEEEALPEEGAVETPVAPEQTDEEAFELRYKRLQGKYNAEVPRLAKELKEMKQNLEALQAASVKTDEPAKPAVDTEILAKLKEDYPEDFIDNLDALFRYRAELATAKAVQPIQEAQQLSEDAQLKQDTEQYVAYLSQKAPTWGPIWSAVGEIEEGLEPSDPKIAEFLAKPDPSGLYTNYDLLVKYNEVWDADRFATVCNMYGAVKAPLRNPSQDALLAPSRTNNQPNMVPVDKKIWTIQEFEQMQRDDRAGKLDPAEADALWADATAAFGEGRFR